MDDTIFPALIVFGILLAITLIGLFASNAAAARLDGSRGGASPDLPGPGALAPRRFEPTTPMDRR